MDRLQETLQILNDARAHSPAVLVAYSGGKDSLAVTDLCLRTFDRVAGFYMELVPGLRTVELMLEEGRQRFGIDILVYPHWVLRRFILDGVYCFNHYRHDSLPKYTLFDIYNLAMLDSGISVIATGMKRSDSNWRRRILAWNQRADVIAPLAGWTKFDVLSYLRSRHIPVPESSGRNMSGLDLSAPELLHLYDTAPDDFERLERVFPFIRAVIYRRQWYGETKRGK